VWGVFSFKRVSKILLGKMVCSSLRWLPAACSMCMLNLSMSLGGPLSSGGGTPA